MDGYRRANFFAYLLSLSLSHVDRMDQSGFPIVWRLLISAVHVQLLPEHEKRVVANKDY